MPLQPQLINIPLGGGIDEKTDPKLVQNGKLVDLQNMQFNKIARLSKRNGYKQYGDFLDNRKFEKIYSGPRGAFTISDPTKETDGIRRFDSVSDSSGNWNAVGPVGAIPKVETLPIFNVTATSISNLAIPLQCADCVTNGTIMFWHWVDDNSSAYYAVTNLSTGEFIVPQTLLYAGTTSPCHQGRIAYWPGSDFIYLAIPNAPSGTYKLCFVKYQISTKTATKYTTPFGSSTAMAAQPFDATVLQVTGTDIIYCCFATTTAGEFVMAKVVTAGMTLSDSLTVTSIGTIKGVCVSSPLTGATNINFFANFAAAAMKGYKVSTSSMATNTAFSFSPAQLPAGSTQMGACDSTIGSTPTSNIFLTTKGDSTAPQNARTSYVRVTSAGISAQTVRYGCICISKPYRDSTTETLYCVAAVITTYQPSYFLLRTSSNSSVTSPTIYPAARILYEDAYYSTSGSYGFQKYMTNMTASGTNIYAPAAKYDDSRLNSATIMQIEFHLAASDGYYSTNANTQSLVTGGYLQKYDGEYLYENGFLTFPEIITASQSTSGSIADGTYEMVAVATWRDSSGNIERSAPSPPFTLVVTGGSGTASINITVCPTKLTMRGMMGRADPKSIILEIYRTAPTVTTGVLYLDYQFVQFVDETIIQTTPADTNTLNLTNSDATLSANPIIYTQGGLQPNWTLDGPSAIAGNGTLLAVNDPNDNRNVYFSKRFQTDQGISLAANFVLQNFLSQGSVTALHFMDDKLIVFRQRAIFFTQGEGFDDLGGGSGFAPFQQISDDIGAINQLVTVLTPSGIFFQSQKGIWLLGRDLSVSYIGRFVESYNSSTLCSAVLVEDQNQVRFATTDGSDDILVYDYFFGQWSIFNNNPQTHAAIVNGLYTFCFVANNSYAPAFYESVGYFQDDSGFAVKAPNITATIQTAPFEMAGIQGFQRVWEARFLGDNKSTHTLTVTVDYDYEGTFSESHSITSANATAGSSVYQMRLFPLRQRCEAIQFKITDSSNSVTQEAFDLNAIALYCGVVSKGIPMRVEKGF